MISGTVGNNQEPSWHRRNKTPNYNAWNYDDDDAIIPYQGHKPGVYPGSAHMQRRLQSVPNGQTVHHLPDLSYVTADRQKQLQAIIDEGRTKGLYLNARVRRINGLANSEGTIIRVLYLVTEAFKPDGAGGHLDPFRVLWDPTHANPRQEPLDYAIDEIEVVKPKAVLLKEQPKVFELVNNEQVPIY